jgi:hypothetical protein
MKIKQTLVGIVILAAVFWVLCAIERYVEYQANSGERGASCGNNMKLLALGLEMYAADNNGMLPGGIVHSYPGVGWANQIYSDVKAEEVFHCPDDKFSIGADNEGNIAISYGFNSNLAHRKTSDCISSAQTVELFETTGSTTDPSIYNPAINAASQYSPAGNGLDGSLYCIVSSPCPAKYSTGTFGRPLAADSQFDSAGPRHQGGSFFAFADSHVKWIQPGTVSAGTNALTSKDAQTGGVTGRAAGTESGGGRPTFSIR